MPTTPMRYVIQVLGDKMNLTVRLGINCFMRVPLVYMPCCPVPNCLGKEGELSGNCLTNLTVGFILSPSMSSPIADKGGGGKNPTNFADVLYVWFPNSECLRPSWSAASPRAAGGASPGRPCRHTGSSQPLPGLGGLLLARNIFSVGHLVHMLNVQEVLQYPTLAFPLLSA